MNLRVFRGRRRVRCRLKNCVVIGDVGSTDMLAAHAVGALKILVLTGWGESSLHQYRDFWKDVEPDHIAQNLLEAVQWLLKIPQKTPVRN